MKSFIILALIGLVGYCASAPNEFGGNGPSNGMSGPGGFNQQGGPSHGGFENGGDREVKETTIKSLAYILQSLLREAIPQQQAPQQQKPMNQNYNCSIGLFLAGHMKRLLDSQNLVALSQKLKLNTTGVNSTMIQKAGFAAVFQRFIVANPQFGLFLMSCEPQVDLVFSQWIVSRQVLQAPNMTNMTLPSLSCPVKIGRNESITYTLNNQTWSLSWSANLSNGSSIRGTVDLSPIRDSFDSIIKIIMNDTVLIAFVEKYWIVPSCPSAFFDLLEIIKWQFVAENFASLGGNQQGPQGFNQQGQQAGPQSGPSQQGPQGFGQQGGSQGGPQGGQQGGRPNF